MRNAILFLFVTLISFGFCALPAVAQTPSASTNLLASFLNKQKQASMQSQTVTPTDKKTLSANRAAYDEAMRKATVSNQQASVALSAAHAAESARKMEQLEAMFAAERAKAAAANTPNPDGSAADRTQTENNVAKKVYKAPANAIRVYTPKKDSGDQPRRLFNVREQ